jgi:hypothetical protein
MPKRGSAESLILLGFSPRSEREEFSASGSGNPRNPLKEGFVNGSAFVLWPPLFTAFRMASMGRQAFIRLTLLTLLQYAADLLGSASCTLRNHAPPER